MSELKPCPFGGSTDRRLIEGDEYCWCMNQRCPIYDYEIRIDKWESRSESPELAALRDQVKVLREACETAKECLDNNGFGKAYVQDELASALDLTKAARGDTKDDLGRQVKVLREALGWLVNEMDCRDDEFGGCLFTRQDFKIARDALSQTKPKGGE